MTFKEKLVKLRKLNKLTQDDFAKAVGVSRQAVYKWESGQSYPEVSKLLEMKVLFNISIDDLLDDNYEVILPEKKRRRRNTQAKIENQVEEVVETVSTEEIAVQQEPAAVVNEVIESEENSEPVTEVASEPVSAEQEATIEDDSAKKKVGFFGRLFGRK